MILITGSTGFLGRALVQHLYGRNQLRVATRDDGKLLDELYKQKLLK